MFLQLKDLTSQKLISVPVEGLTFGREGGDAQLQVPDMGVSKRHAEVFYEDGSWYLKDLGSSNGTMLANERIGDPTELLPGDVFQLSKRKFEVLKVVDGDDPGDAPSEPDLPAMTEPVRESVARAAKPAPAAKRPATPVRPSAAPKVAPTRDAQPSAVGPEADAEGDDELGKAGVGRVLSGVPKAIAYYLVNVPLMLLNPLGTIRKGVEERPAEPMGRLELIAWALPATLFIGAVGVLSTVLTALITGQVGAAIASSVVGLVVGAVVGAVVAVVLGLIWHSLTSFFVVKLFKGSCDARGRTNFFLQSLTVSILVALPGGLSTIVSAVIAQLGGGPLRFLMLVPIVMSAAATGLVFFMQYRWYDSFNVARWVKTVMLVLAALSAASRLVAVGAVVKGGGPVMAGAPTDLPQPKAPGAPAIEDDEPEPQAKRPEGVDATGPGAAAAKPPEPGAAPPSPAIDKPGEGAPRRDDAAGAKNDAAKTPPRAAEPTAPERPREAQGDTPRAGADVPVAENLPAAPPEARTTPPSPPQGTGYPAWRAKVDAIERRISDDPTLLKGAVLKGYLALQEKTAEADTTVRKAYKKADVKTLGHLRDAELYEKSKGTVNDLYKALFPK
ncbi:MAG: FHA domain-containing protein [Myxococcaceae bacterium]|jgi:hypothetical protein|nr:FHA domain-containing protein [Myxococcaceae bacterium]MCA3013714.1 FHA domain-containing protein [Myxococcaceae bacterium]